LDPGTGYEKRIELIRNSKYAGIVDCVDLDIRHSESHTANTTIDDDKGQIVLTRLLNDGSRAVVRTYTYAQFTDMLMCMERGLLPAMLYEFGVVRFAILGTLMHSIEYVHLLLSIDNLAD